MKRRWVVEWVAPPAWYGFALVADDPVIARFWTRWGAKRCKADLEAERLSMGGSSGSWRIRRNHPPEA